MLESTRKFGKNQYLFHCFLSIRDPRVGGRCSYSLLSILIIVLCGLICGCNGWKAIELFAKTRKRWLSQFIDLSEGIPSHQTLGRVFSLIDPLEFEHCIRKWIEEISVLFVDDVIAIERATRYYITSLPYKKHRKMQEAIRQHWQIENGLHYKLDVGMNEDQCPIYRGYSDRNLSIMRKIVLKLLTEDKSSQEGIALKRLKAALSTRYLRKVVGF